MVADGNGAEDDCCRRQLLLKTKVTVERGSWRQTLIVTGLFEGDGYRRQRLLKMMVNDLYGRQMKEKFLHCKMCETGSTRIMCHKIDGELELKNPMQNSRKKILEVPHGKQIRVFIFGYSEKLSQEFFRLGKDNSRKLIASRHLTLVYSGTVGIHRRISDGCLFRIDCG